MPKDASFERAFQAELICYKNEWSLPACSKNIRKCFIESVPLWSKMMGKGSKHWFQVALL